MHSRTLLIAALAAVLLAACAAPAGAAAETPPLGRIAGVVTFAPPGAPEEGIYVCAQDPPSPRACAATGAGGAYAIEGLAAGTYTVEFTGSTCLAANCLISYEPQWWNDVALATAATPVVVAAGATVAGIDARLSPVHDPVQEYLEKAREAPPFSSGTGELPGAIKPLPVNQRAMEEFWAHPPWQSGAGQAPGATTAASALPLLTRRPTLRAAVVHAAMRCAATVACAGTLHVLARLAHLRRVHVAGHVVVVRRLTTAVLAAEPVSLAAGTSHTFTLRLRGAALALAQRAGSHGLGAVVTRTVA